MLDTLERGRKALVAFGRRNRLVLYRLAILLGWCREVESLRAPIWVSCVAEDGDGRAASVEVRWLGTTSAYELRRRREGGVLGSKRRVVRTGAARLLLRPGAHEIIVRQLRRYGARVVASPPTPPLRIEVSRVCRIRVGQDAWPMAVRAEPAAGAGHTAEMGPTAAIFVGGAARTGTTLMQAILCADSATSPLLSEAVPLLALVESYDKDLRNFERFSGDFYASRQELTGVFEQHMTILKAYLGALHGGKTVVLKLPQLTRRLPLLLELMPQDLMVCMLRDPRAAIASMKIWGRKAKARGEEHPYAVWTVEDFASHFNGFYTFLFQEGEPVPDSRVLFVRYEDLVSWPENVVDQLRSFTGLALEGFDRDAAWQDVRIDMDPGTSPIGDALTDLYGGPISASRLDAWHDVLTPEEVQVIESRCAPFMRSFDYAPDSATSSDSPDASRTRAS